MPFILPDTGQVIEYRSGDDSNYGLDVEDYNNDDGHAGLSYTKLDTSGNDLPNEAASWEFVRDNRTQLIWKILSTPGGTWEQDMASAAAYNALGKTWRIPTIKELLYLSSYNRTDVNFDDMIGFVDTGQPYVRSSVERISNPDHVWGLDKIGGYPNFIVSKSSTGFPVFYVTGEIVSPSFTDNGDDTITDASTGLTWTKYLLGGDGLTPPDTMNWNDAIDQTLSLSFAGYDDWRLPNAKELQSIIIFGNAGLGIDTNFFPQIPANTKLWSSTTVSLSTPDAWVAYLDSDLRQAPVPKTSTSEMYVIAVRGMRSLPPAVFWHNHTIQKELLSTTSQQLWKESTLAVIPGKPGQPYIAPVPATSAKTSVKVKVNYVCKRVWP